MTILYSFPHRLGLPGIGTTAACQIAALERLGTKVIAVCGSFSPASPETQQRHSTLMLGPWRIPQKAIGVDRSYRLHDWLTARLLRRLGPTVAAVHCWPLGSLRTLAVAKELGIPTFLERPNTHTEHAYQVVEDECARIQFALPKSNSHRPSARRLARELAEYAAADYLLVPSEAVADTFRVRGFVEKKLKLTRYGCDLQRFQPAPGLGQDGGQGLKVLFLGRCEPRKGLHYALSAWQKAAIGDAGKFTIVGRFVDGYREHLGDLLRQPGVEIQDFNPNPAGLLAAHHALVLPSVEEGSALVTYEAMASGCVPLVTKESGAFVEHGSNALVHRLRDTEELARHFRTLHDDGPLRARLQMTAAARRDELSWDAAAKTLIAAYQTGREPSV